VAFVAACKLLLDELPKSAGGLESELERLGDRHAGELPSRVVRELPELNAEQIIGAVSSNIDDRAIKPETLEPSPYSRSITDAEYSEAEAIVSRETSVELDPTDEQPNDRDVREQVELLKR